MENNGRCSTLSMATPRNVLNVIYLSGFLDLLGVSLVLPWLSSYAKDLGASPTVIGILGSLYGTLQFISGPYLGKWSDITGHRHALIICLILSAVGYFALGFSYSLVVIFLARIPLGIFKHSRTITKAYITDVISKDLHSAVFGRFNAVCSIGFILGPPVGGHIAELRGGFHIAAMLAGGMFLLNAALLWYLVPDVKPKHKPKVRLKVTTRETELRNNNEEEVNEKEVTKDVQVHSKQEGAGSSSPLHLLKSFQDIDWKDLWDIFLIRLILGIGTLLYKNQYALFLKTRFNASPSAIGYMMSYSAIVSACTGFVVGHIAKWYKNDTKLLHHAACVMFVSFVVTALVPSTFFLLIIETPLAVSIAIARVCITSLTIEKGHQNDSGALLGLGQSVTAMGRIIAPTLAGFSSEISIVAPNLISATCTLVVFNLLLVLPGMLPEKKNDKMN